MWISRSHPSCTLLIGSHSDHWLGERTRFGPLARSLVTVWLLQPPGQDRQAVMLSSPDDVTSRFSILWIILLLDSDMTSLPVAKQSKRHRQGRHLLYKGFLILLLITKWKQNKSQTPPIPLHWPPFLQSQWVFSSHSRPGCCRGDWHPACRHPVTPRHTKHEEPQQSHANLGTGYSNIQSAWCRTVLFPLLPILNHLVWSFSTFCYWEVLHCWCLQPAFEMLQKESLGLWKCIFFFHKISSRFCWVMNFENSSFSSVLSHFP